MSSYFIYLFYLFFFSKSLFSSRLLLAILLGTQFHHHGISHLSYSVPLTHIHFVSKLSSFYLQKEHCNLLLGEATKNIAAAS